MSLSKSTQIALLKYFQDTSYMHSLYNQYALYQIAAGYKKKMQQQNNFRAD